MKFLLAAITICLLATSCVSSRSMEDVLGMKTGSSVKTLRSSVLTESDFYTSTSSIWLGGDRIRASLNAEEPPADSPLGVLGHLPKGTTVYLDKVKHANLIDWKTGFFEAHYFRNSKQINFVILFYQAKIILGLPKAEQSGAPKH